MGAVVEVAIGMVAMCARSPDRPVITYLLAETQDLEALEVGQVLPALRAVGLLSKAGLGPLAIDLVLRPKLLHGAGTGSTGELGDGEGGEGGVGEGKNVTGHDLLLLTGGTVDQDLHENRESIHCSHYLGFLRGFSSSPTHSESNFEKGRSTYTAVVDNLDDGSELAFEGAAADQDEAANLDQLPRSELDIDIGHGEGFLQRKSLSARSDRYFCSENTHGRQPGIG